MALVAASTFAIIFARNSHSFKFSNKINNKIKIGIFCGSSLKLSQYQHSQLNAMFKNLNKFEYEIVYGGGKQGTMGQVGELAVSNGLSLRAIDSTQFGADQYSQAQVTLYNKLVPRTDAFITIVDIAIILPGNYGTLMELFWLATLNNIHETKKKIIIWNMDNYYDELIEFVKSNKFQHGSASLSLSANDIVVCNTYQEVVKNISC